MQIKNAIGIALCAVCAGAALTIHSAAQIPTVYHPGDKIPFRVKFEGVNADKLDKIILNFQTNNVTRKGQETFQMWVESGEMKMVSPGVYEVSVDIPLYAASGTYQINVITTSIGPFIHQYTDGLPRLMFTIDNPKEVPQFPDVKGIEQTSHRR